MKRQEELKIYFTFTIKWHILKMSKKQYFSYCNKQALLKFAENM
jgi:hypothetical protein